MMAREGIAPHIVEKNIEPFEGDVCLYPSDTREDGASSRIVSEPLKYMVSPAGFEPATY